MARSRVTATSGITSAQLRSYVERIERLMSDKADIAGDIKAVFDEAKAQGYDTATMRKVIRLRAMEESDRQEQQALLDLYCDALGILIGTPLGDAAIKAETRRVAESDQQRVAKGAAKLAAMAKADGATRATIQIGDGPPLALDDPGAVTKLADHLKDATSRKLGGRSRKAKATGAALAGAH